MKQRHKQLIVTITNENGEVLETYDLAESYQCELADVDFDGTPEDARKATIDGAVDDIGSFLTRFQP